jgi:hypothetical protein
MSAPASITASARALVERTTVPRGLPVCVEDPVALARVATLRAAGRRATPRRGRSAGWS